MARYKFLKTPSRVTFFAEIDIEALANRPFSISWDNDTPSLRRWLGNAVEHGIASAYQCT